MKRSNLIIPNWLVYALLAAFLFSTMAVFIFAYLTFQEVVQRPLNPIDNIAVAALTQVDVQVAPDDSILAPVVAMATPTLIPT